MKEKDFDKKKEELKELLQVELYGKIPLFFKQAVIKDSIDNISYNLTITDYNTTKFRNKPYHKMISKIF